MRYINRILDMVESRVSLFLILGSPAVIGVVSAYIASAQEFMKPYGDLGWIFAGLAALFLAAMCSFLYVLTRYLHTRKTAVEHWKARSDNLNPLDRSFERKRITLSDLVDPITNEICGKTITDCDLLGPCNLVLGENVTLEGINFHNSDFVVLKLPSRVFNGVKLTRTHIHGGRFSRVTLYIPPNLVETIRKFGGEPITYYEEEHG